jgi:hypothetical protein
MRSTRAMIAAVLIAAAQALGSSCYLVHERCPAAEAVPADLPRAGFVGVEVFHSPGAESIFAASFHPRTWAELAHTGVASECRVLVEEAGCIAVACATVAASVDDAGEISASIDDAPLAAIDRSGTGGPYAMLLTDPPASGETVHFRATGGADVPAFEGCATIPSAPDAELPASITRGAPLTLTWGTTDADTMNIGIDGSGPSVRCVVPASSGSMTVPPSITSLLGPGPVDLGIEARDEHLVAAGRYEVHVLGSQGIAALVPVD